MYELLFRSRWYALAWAVFMAVSAVMLSKDGPGAWFFGAHDSKRAGQEAREPHSSTSAEDESAELGAGPVTPPDGSDDAARTDETGGLQQQPALVAPDESAVMDGAVGQ